MIFNDMDQWREALSKCHLSESSMPTSRGYLVENVECYNKIQKMLDAPEMENCHKFLYNLDVEDLSEAEIAKVDKLYELGKARGVIEDDEEDEETDECDICGDQSCSDPASHVAAPDAVVPSPAPVPAVPPMKVCAFTVMYSAMKDGTIKTGEAYSNAISPRSAKADVLAKLSQLGYENVTILAIEAGDPDSVGQTEPVGMDVNFVPPAQDVPADTSTTSFESDDEDEIEEADDEEEDDSADDSEKNDKEEKSDDKSDDKDDEESADDDSKEATDKSDDKADDKDDEEADDADDKDDKSDDNELDDTQKNQLKDQYKKAFKAAMLKCKFEKAFNDLNLEEKVKLFTELNKTWKDKADPSEFMTPKETDALNKVVMKR